MAQTIVIGNMVGFTATFTNRDGQPVNPSTVAFELRGPDGVVLRFVYGEDADVIKIDEGVYRLDYAPTSPGSWAYRVEATGTGMAAAQDKLTVKASLTD